MAKIIFTKTECIILCDKGHLLEYSDLKNWAGSRLEAEVAEYQGGTQNRIYRLENACNGYGHNEKIYEA